jgi:cysteine sulfinate desulfinase/cysteine desulfurase-like protein
MCEHAAAQYGNPHSRTHLYGWESEEAVEKARAQVCESGRRLGVIAGNTSLSLGPN